MYFVLLLLSIMKLSKCIQSLQEIYDYVTPENCTNSQYFDISLFKCVSCNLGYIKGEDGFSCVCSGTNKVSENRIWFERNSSECIPRECINLVKNKTSCLSCKENQILIVNNMNGTTLSESKCITCATGYIPSPDKSSCQLCPNNLYFNNNSYKCECNLYDSKLIDDICIPNSFIKSLKFYQPKYTEKSIFKSLLFEKLWIVSNYFCSLRNSSACQMVANICVYSLYDSSIESFCHLVKNTKIQGFPNLMYEEDESYSVLYKKKINIVYNLNDDTENGNINIIALGYSLNGKSIKYIDMNSQLLNICPSIWKFNKKNALKFGTNYRQKCKIGVQQLIEQSEPMLYELYLKYYDKDSTNQLYAIPVLIRGPFVDFNEENDINSWQLVKRFFLFDKVSGVDVNDGNNIKFARYANYIQIKIRIRKKGKGERNKIYPPLVIIHYDEINEKQIIENQYVDIEFFVNFVSDDGGMVHGMEIAVGSLSAFAVLYSILQVWSYSRRSGRFGLNPYIFVQFLIFVCGNLSNVFFVVSFGTSIFAFIIYKTQKVVYAVIPSNKDEYTIQSYLIVALSLKLVEVIALNWKQINIDICFVDWEKPILPANDISTRASNVKVDPPLSFWRPYFVANEWNEIQALRKISLPLHIIACIFVLEIFGAAIWTSIGVEVSTESTDGVLKSIIFQFALSGLTFLFLYFIQLFVSIFIYERFIKNAILDFMDVCSIANVSLIIFDESLYGYYLHGRCVHASCDVDVRGLQSGLPNRAFIFQCTSEFRLYFDRLSAHVYLGNVPWQWQHHLIAENINNGNLTAKDIQTSRRSSCKLSRRGTESITSNSISYLPPILEQRALASNLVNKFLTAFFDHALEDLDYEVRERRYIERLFDIELTNESNYKTLLLYNLSGDSQSFQRAIWYGQEWTLATFDLYLFCMIQLLSGSYILAALITIIVWKLLDIFRRYGGKKNLAKKTLVDERFLI